MAITPCPPGKYAYAPLPPPLPPHHLIIIIIVYWNTVAIPISCVSFYSYSECWSNFGVIWGFFGPNGVIFRAWGRFKNCSGVYSYVLTSLISIGFTKPLFQNFLKIFWRQTDRPTDRQTDRPTLLPIELLSQLKRRTLASKEMISFSQNNFLLSWRI